jgi:hypothetical protein
MSVYSGFATRQQETFYDRLLEKLIEILCEKIMNIYNGRKLYFKEDLIWIKCFKKF